MQDVGLEDLLHRWKDEPYLFVTQCIGAKPDEWQEQTLRALKYNNRLAVKSGHGVGKSCLIAWVILWWVTTRTPARVLVTSASERQLKRITWPEVSLWLQKLTPLFRDNVSVEGELIYLRGYKDINFATQVVPRRDMPEALQGFHAEHQLVIGDEASGLPDQTLVTGEGAMSTVGSKTLLCGNPTRAVGYFIDCFGKNREEWWNHTVSCYDAKMVDREWLKRMERQYGDNPHVFNPRVLGLPPPGDTEALISLGDVNACISNEADRHTNALIVWGIDVARFGNNRSVLTKRRGNHLIEPQFKWQNKTGPETVAIILREWKECQTKTPDLLPVTIKIDAIGVGGPVADTLETYGLPIDMINVNKDKMIYDSEFNQRFGTTRDLLAYRLRDWIMKPTTVLEYDQDLIDSLTAPRVNYDGGYVKLESKHSMRMRGAKPMDEFDSLMLTFSDEDVLAPEFVVPDRYAARNQRREEGSWMTL